MSKFKKGDRVRIVSNRIPCVGLGIGSGEDLDFLLRKYPNREGIVIEIRTDLDIAGQRVTYARIRNEKGNELWWFYASGLELIDEQLSLFGDLT